MVRKVTLLDHALSRGTHCRRTELPMKFLCVERQQDLIVTKWASLGLQAVSLLIVNEEVPFVFYENQLFDQLPCFVKETCLGSFSPLNT
jgi:hypothetical protein